MRVGFRWIGWNDAKISSTKIAFSKQITNKTREKSPSKGNKMRINHGDPFSSLRLYFLEYQNKPKWIAANRFDTQTDISRTQRISRIPFFFVLSLRHNSDENLFLKGWKVSLLYLTAGGSSEMESTTKKLNFIPFWFLLEGPSRSNFPTVNLLNCCEIIILSSLVDPWTPLSSIKNSFMRGRFLRHMFVFLLKISKIICFP